MQIKSLKHNFIMYFLRTFFNLSFSIIIFPIVARKLGAENLGKIQYVEVIVAYFLLFINLGVENYGKREVALYRNNRENLSEIVCEILFLLLITTIIGIVFYILFIKFMVSDLLLKKILIIYSLNIILNFLGLEWFYVGIEDQSYITKRNLFFKIISAIMILFFIKSKEDTCKYAGILVFSIVGVNLLNIYNLRRFIKFKKIQIIKLKKHIKPLFLLFFSVLALSISYNLDSIMIKQIIGDKELGYYSFAMKFGKLPLVLPTAIVAIFYPRLCNLLGQDKKEDYCQLTTLGIELILLFSFPMSIGMFLVSDIVVTLFGGIEFMPSIPIMKVFSMFTLVMGIAFCTGSMTLIANKKDKVYLFSVIVGSILNFIFNIIFISRIGALGAAIATLITEIAAIVIRITFCKDIFKNIKIFNINLLKIVMASILMGIIVQSTKSLFSKLIFNLILNIFLGGGSYFLLLLLMKEKNVMNVLQKIEKLYKEKKI